MKQQELKVSFYLKKNEIKEDGRCPLMAILSIGKYSETTFSTKTNVPLSLWQSGRATGKSQIANEINQRLDAIRASALSHYKELSAVNEKVTAENVKTLLLGMAYGQETLLDYFRTHNENFDKRIGVNRKKVQRKATGTPWPTLPNFWKSNTNFRIYLSRRWTGRLLINSTSI